MSGSSKTHTGAVKFQADQQCIVDYTTKEKCSQQGHYWDPESKCCTLGGCQVLSGTRREIMQQASQLYQNKKYNVALGLNSKCSI